MGCFRSASPSRSFRTDAPRRPPQTHFGHQMVTKSHFLWITPSRALCRRASILLSTQHKPRLLARFNVMVPRVRIELRLVYYTFTELDVIRITCGRSCTERSTVGGFIGTGFCHQAVTRPVLLAEHARERGRGGAAPVRPSVRRRPAWSNMAVPVSEHAARTPPTVPRPAAPPGAQATEVAPQSISLTRRARPAEPRR